jgi:hypothetical protein
MLLHKCQFLVMTLTQVFKYMLEKKDVIKHILYEYIGCNVVEQSFCK